VAAGKLTVVFGDRGLVAGGHFGRVGVADHAALVFVELVAKLEFERVDFADQLLVHLLYQRRVARETAGVEISHLIDQRLQFGARFRAILHDGADPVEEVEALGNLRLGIGGVGSLLRRNGVALNATVAGVVGSQAVLLLAIASTARHTVADIAGAAWAVLPALPTLTVLATLTLTLTLTLLLALALALTLSLALLTSALAAELLLSLLPGSTSLASLPALALLTLLTRLTRLGVLTSAQSGDLIAQTRQIVHGTIDRYLVRIALARACAHGSGGFADLLAEFLQIVGERGFGLIGKATAAELIRTALKTRSEIGFIRALKSAAQFGGSTGLGGREFARRIADLLGQPRKIVAHLLAIIDHLVDFLRGRDLRLLARSACRVLLRHDVAHLIRLLLLPCRELLGGLRHGADASAGILLLHASEQVCGLAQAVGRATGVGGTRIL